VAGITFKIQQTTREIERHIDRANGAPAVEAAMCCDDGTEEIGHDSYALLIVMLSRHQPVLVTDCSLREGRRTLLARFGLICQLLIRNVSR
jgi:hypothetical protein